MKMMKLALLGGAALAVTAAGARADDLSALKAEIEALNSRVAQLEATPSVPAGYSLVAFGRGTMTPDLGNSSSPWTTSKSHVVSVVPTADAPATASISWSGYIREALRYTEDTRSTASQKTSIDITDSRARIVMNAVTATAVGDVGVDTQFTNTQFDYYRGWWAMTPEWTLAAGLMDNYADIGQGETVGSTINMDGAEGNETTDQQIRLSYASGPMSFGIAVDKNNGDGKVPDIHAGLGYSSDSMGMALAAYWNDEKSTSDDYQIAGTAHFGVSMMDLRVAGNIGRDDSDGKYWTMSSRAKMNMTDATYFELSGGYKEGDAGGGGKFHRYNINTGIYWTPVSQLTIGLQGDYTDQNKDNLDGSWESGHKTTAAFVTWFRF
jgi:hypothetical protein